MGNYAMMLVLILTVLVSTFNGNTRQNLYQAQLDIVESYNRSNARNIAQSVAMIIVSKIENSDDSTLEVGSDSTRYYPAQGVFEAWPSMSGSFSIEWGNSGDTLLSVAITGKSENESYLQTVLMSRPDSSSSWDPNLNYSVFSNSIVELKGGASIKGHVATNATGRFDVTLTGGAAIDSNLYIGPGGNPSTVVKGSSLVSGSIINLPSELDFSLPDFPEYPDGYTPTSSVTINWSNNGLTLNPVDYANKHYPSINIGSNYSLNINTGSDDQVLFVEDLNITQGHLNVIGTGTLTIYVEDAFILNGSSTVNNNTQDSEKVMVYYGGATRLQFAGSTKLYSDIFIESADLKITGSGGVQGHVISGGGNVDISGSGTLNTRILYTPLADVKLAGGSVLYGAVICESFSAVGGARVDFSSGVTTQLPDLEGASGGNDRSFTAFAWF